MEDAHYEDFLDAPEAIWYEPAFEHVGFYMGSGTAYPTHFR